MNTLQYLNIIDSRIDNLEYFLINGKHTVLSNYLQGVFDIFKILKNQDNTKSEVLYEHILQMIDREWEKNT